MSDRRVEDVRLAALCSLEPARRRTIRTKVVGVTFGQRQEVIAERCRPGVKLLAYLDLGNLYDRNAVGLVVDESYSVGYLSRELAADLAPHLRAGGLLDAEVTEVTGGGEGKSRGVNVIITVVPFEEPQ